MQEEDAAIFFGRDGQIVRALDELRNLRFAGTRQVFSILAASGAGKSSFLRAGLLPRLRRDDRNFVVLSAVRPLGNVLSRVNDGLAAAFHAVANRLGLTMELANIKSALLAKPGFEELIDQIRAAALRQIQIGDPATIAPIVVVSIDQAEELVAETGGEEAAQALQLMRWLIEMRGKVLTLLTIRSDQVEQLHEVIAGLSHETLPFQLGAIETAEYGRLIDGPAERLSASGRNLTIEPTLRDQIIQDIRGLGDILPLLALTMNRLHLDYGSDGKLALHEYQAMGEIRGAIDNAAKGAMSNPGLPPIIAAEVAKQNSDLRKLFVPRLLRIDKDVLRRPARADSFEPAEIAYIERLQMAGLLQRDSREGSDFIEISHEAVLRNWRQLKVWSDDGAADLQIIETLEHSAREWNAEGRMESGLVHADVRLQAAERIWVDAGFQKIAEPEMT